MPERELLDVPFMSEPSDTLERERERKINIIENINCGLSQRVMMVLVVLGLKPATELSLFSWNEDVESVKNKLKEADLFFDDINKSAFNNKDQTAWLAIATSCDLATKVASIFSDVSENGEELGKYMGYPQTAIDAFSGKIKRLEKFDTAFENAGISPEMFSFALSEDNWEEEIKTAQKWVEAIKLNAPELYKKIIEIRK